jgi:acyl-CoA reductase-like NAD-dependent aldehyde dehydrogenase
MSDTIKLISPVDGSVYAERPVATGAEIDQAVAEARAAQVSWAATPLSERCDAVLAAVAALEAMNDEIVPELAWQMGRPIRYGGEQGGTRERTDYMVKIAEEALKPRRHTDRPGFTRYVRPEPLGVVMVIAPWNYPFMTAINTIVPALIAGNTVILKHSAQTLLVGERLDKAFRAAGLPKGVFRNIVLNHGQTEALLGSGRIDHINFTGSVAGGRAIEKAAAGTFASLGLELGGKDPAYIRADADVAAAIDGIADGAFFNSGQCCCGIERIYVHESHFDTVVEGLVNFASSYKLGNPLEEATTLGPMAQARFAAHVREQTAEALRKGARALVDPKLFPANEEGTPYLMPQVLVDVDHQMSVMREESFGPVVGVMKVRDDEEAVSLMNDSPYGLTASIWTADEAAAISVGDRIETGTVFMNRCDYLDPALVWTGVKETGRGAALSEYGYMSLTRPKSYHLRTSL